MSQLRRLRASAPQKRFAAPLREIAKWRFRCGQLMFTIRSHRRPCCTTHVIAISRRPCCCTSHWSRVGAAAGSCPASNRCPSRAVPGLLQLGYLLGGCTSGGRCRQTLRCKWMSRCREAARSGCAGVGPCVRSVHHCSASCAAV